MSQTVIFTLFISAAGLVLCDHYYNNLCTKIGHLCHFISQKAEIGHRCSHLNLAFKVILLHNYKILLCESPYPIRDYFLSYKNLKKRKEVGVTWYNLQGAFLLCVGGFFVCRIIIPC